MTELTTDLDRFAYDQALSVFLCAPQALYAVNRHVAFDGYAATFELAETEVTPEHWSALTHGSRMPDADAPDRQGLNGCGGDPALSRPQWLRHDAAEKHVWAAWTSQSRRHRSGTESGDSMTTGSAIGGFTLDIDQLGWTRPGPAAA